jgi:hypothetical protein
MKIGGLKQTTITPVPGVVSPTQSNSANPTQVGSQATVKQAKPKKPGQATDKPSVFFKSESIKPSKKTSIEKLRTFLEQRRNKR